MDLTLNITPCTRHDPHSETTTAVWLACVFDATQYPITFETSTDRKDYHPLRMFLFEEIRPGICQPVAEILWWADFPTETDAQQWGARALQAIRDGQQVPRPEDYNGNSPHR